MGFFIDLILPAAL